MFKQIEALVGTIGAFAWGPPMLIFLVGTGFYLTITLRGVQFRKLWYSLWLALVKRKEETAEPGDITHFQALMTALYHRHCPDGFNRHGDPGRHQKHR